MKVKVIDKGEKNAAIIEGMARDIANTFRHITIKQAKTIADKYYNDIHCTISGQLLVPEKVIKEIQRM